MGTRTTASAELMPRSRWRYLARRPGSWRKQLYVKGTRLPAAQVWRSVVGDGCSIAEAAVDCGIRVEAVEECVRYAEQNRDLIREEADVERADAEKNGVPLEPPLSR